MNHNHISLSLDEFPPDRSGFLVGVLAGLHNTRVSGWK